MGYASKVGIAGVGTVGSSVHALFPDAILYDPPKGYLGNLDDCEVVFVAVPTPTTLGRVDVSIVEHIVQTFDPGIFVVRSTVPPGTSSSLARKHDKEIVFQPEYLGMTPGHAYASDRDVPFVILGDTWQRRASASRVVAQLYRDALPAETAFHFTSAVTAELVKYMTNTFLALKVEFINEMFDAATELDVDYDQLRELWLLDPRIGRSHTAVNPNDRGFGGLCFPKDVAGLVGWADDFGVSLPVLLAAHLANVERRP